LKHKIKPDSKLDLFKEGVTFEGLIRQQKHFLNIPCKIMCFWVK